MTEVETFVVNVVDVLLIVYLNEILVIVSVGLIVGMIAVVIIIYIQLQVLSHLPRKLSISE